VNAANNAANLDVTNGGFTVFGQVLGDGMDVVDEILALNRFNYGSPFNNLPLKDFTAEQASSGAEPTGDNLIVISDIVVIDATVVTNPNLNPVRNTSVDAGGDDGDSDSGGSIGWLLVSVLGLFAIRKRVIRS
jgi:peptidyl-prolyl cis-trans isomerase A (cyclophilin A)